ncbi:unnamed protein product [Acanthoscelides obtectus]|uniref:Uncharacterized protein n=1 Tax=Acanthoscelides obtectus TaxID=200917 RepID=A0A9P0PJ92_ACAOB|nr:unnamed protein product [Acanthoscelides obtectus]CAK1661150.1 hypothetical protein AOBTE_LOCUS22476 [Acanthoscelides obtectus]
MSHIEITLYCKKSLIKRQNKTNRSIKLRKIKSCKYKIASEGADSIPNRRQHIKIPPNYRWLIMDTK